MNSSIIRAAVLREIGGPFAVETLQLEAPRADEVLVRIVATGVCHTDAAVREGDVPCPVPVVLGHEGAGVVEQVGTGVFGLDPGDHVVLTFDRCGGCADCNEHRPARCTDLMSVNLRGARGDGSHALHAAAGGLVHDRFFGQSSFATHAIANERNAVKVRRDVPLEFLGPLGCGIQTGAGAVMNVLDVAPGDAIAVFGVGGVGLAAIMAARVRGAATIIAVDVVPSRLDVARELGASHVVNGRSEDVAAAIAGLTGRGVDHGFDTTGRPEIIATAVRALAPGGCCALVSGGSAGMRLDIDAIDFIVGRKRLVGVMEGDADPHAFIPELVELFRAGQLPLQRLVEFFSLDQIEEAFAAARSGRVIKPIIIMPSLSS